MTDDTAAILAALDSLDDAFRHAYLSGVAPASFGIFEAWLIARHDTLRALRSRIEKERQFLEAAIRVRNRLYERSLGDPNPVWWADLEAAYRALVSEKPPEDFDMNKAWFAALRENPEGATMREKPPGEGVK